MASPARCLAVSTLRSAPWSAGCCSGVLENLAGAYVIGTDLKLTFALVIIVGVLTVRPSGLFGKIGRVAGLTMVIKA